MPARRSLWHNRVMKFFSSLQFAVIVILSLTLALIVATVLESKFDTPTAQYFVYQSIWFRLILLALGINIFVVAVSRWPWKRHHLAFLLAHAGILLLLGGSWVTQRYGLDGSMRLAEGQATSVVDLQEPVLFMMDGTRVETVPIGWRPPTVSFTPQTVKNYPLRVEEFLTHADPDVSFVALPEREAGTKLPALLLRVQGGPMRIVQDYWLWTGHTQFSSVQAGPSWLTLEAGTITPPAPRTAGPRFFASIGGDGSLKWIAFSSTGKKVSGHFATGKAEGQVLHPGWRGDVTLTLVKVLADATADTRYVASRVQYGNQAPSSAIRIVTTEGPVANSMWLGLGERGSLEIAGKEVGLAYLPRRVVLPFQIQLDQFQIDRYAGTRDPSAYWSRVQIPGKETVSKSIKISMNEPLHEGGITFYQASYEDADPRPTVSILSVNRDPGRAMKYAGSLLLVAGCVFLFYQKLKNAKPARVRQEVV